MLHLPSLTHLEGPEQLQPEIFPPSLPFAQFEHLTPSLSVPSLPDHPSDQDSALAAFFRAQLSTSDKSRASLPTVRGDAPSTASSRDNNVWPFPTDIDRWGDVPSRCTSPASSACYEEQDPPETRGVLTWDSVDEFGKGNVSPNSPSPYLTDARVKAEDPSDVDLFEAVMQGLSTVPDADARTAPAYQASDVNMALLGTASLGTSSTHFQWDTKHERFGWSGRVLRQAQARAIKERRRAGKMDTTVESMQQWVGGERIEGWSHEASDSVVLRFLRVGSLLRRLETRLSDLRSPADAVGEAHALAHAVETITNWLRTELVGWAGSHRTVAETAKHAAHASILGAWLGLEMPEHVLMTLASLLACPFERSPPYRPLPLPSNSAALLTHIHGHLSASIASHAPQLVQAMLAWIAGRTTAAWRADVASWIGWPGATSSRLLAQVHVGDIDAVSGTAGPRRETFKRVEPWAGAEIEWGLDERGEEDVGYVLRPSRLPSFVSVSTARDLLEGGRALRLLRKAAPPDHPLLVSLSDRTLAASALPMPEWLWDAATIDRRAQSVRQHISAVRQSIARWRRRRGEDLGSRAPSSDLTVRDFSLGALIVTSPATVSMPGGEAVTGAQTAIAGTDWQSAQNMFDALPTSQLDVAKVHAGKVTTAETTMTTPRESLVLFLAHRLQQAHKLVDARSTVTSGKSKSLHIDAPHLPSLLPPTVQDLDALTRLSLLFPLQRWSNLINSALISVFFRDLGLGIYLETCRHFLLLGHSSFVLRVRDGLFGDGEGDREVEESVGNKGGIMKGIGLSRRLREGGQWPPGSAELSAVLNPAVMETVAEMKTSLEKGDEHATKPGGKGQGSLIAIRDLDERLSFAIVAPERAKKGDMERWRDPDSIEALDWLTLSFFPPPLIAPLLTPHASSMYQRLFNFLLRLMRVQSVLRGLSLDTTKPYNGSGHPNARRPLPFSDDTASHVLLLSFRHEAHHLMSALGSFVEDVAIRDTWSRFQSRLEALRKDAEARDDQPFRDGAGAAVGAPSDPGRTEGGEAASDNEKDGDVDADLRELELKDVFSLARYHEMVLSRMLSACFLRQRQKGVRKMMNDLLQIILDLGRLVKDVRVRGTGDGVGEGWSSRKDREALANLHRRYQSRFTLLLRALAILRERGGAGVGSRAAVSVAAVAPKVSTATSRAEAGRLELQRQEAEGEADLRMLMGDGAHQEGDVALVADLMSRLDLFGRWR